MPPSSLWFRKPRLARLNRVPEGCGRSQDLSNGLCFHNSGSLILDLTDVPYMHSSGLGMIVRHYVRCQGKGVRLIAAGVSPRVLELFKLTKVEAVFSMTATVEEADTD
jgi:anti-anti-sigma factor